MTWQDLSAFEAPRCAAGNLHNCASGPTSVCILTDRSTEGAVMMLLHTALSRLDQSHACEDAICGFFAQRSRNLPKLVMKQQPGLRPLTVHGHGTSLGTDPSVSRWQITLCPLLILSAGRPQGCVISPLLVSLFTHDCSPIHPTNTIFKSANDTTVVGWLGTTMSQPTGTDFFSIKHFSFLMIKTSAAVHPPGLRTLTRQKKKTSHGLARHAKRLNQGIPAALSCCSCSSAGGLIGCHEPRKTCKSHPCRGCKRHRWPWKQMKEVYLMWTAGCLEGPSASWSSALTWQRRRETTLPWHGTERLCTVQVGIVTARVISSHNKATLRCIEVWTAVKTLR